MWKIYYKKKGKDDTIDATKLCDGDGIGSGKCLKAVSMSEKICKVTVARPIGKLDREKGDIVYGIHV